MESTKEDWSKYKERLVKLGYTEEQIKAIFAVREGGNDHCTDSQFKELVQQGIVIRTRKLNKPRNYYVTDEGKFLYLDYYWKKMNFAGYFKQEE